MAGSAAPPVHLIDVTLPLGAGVVDLATRALVVAAIPSPRWGREAEVMAGVAAAGDAGADLAEVPADPRLLGPAAAQGRIPVAAKVSTAEAATAALAAGAGLLFVPSDRLDEIAQVPELADSGRIVVLVDSARAGRDAVDASPERAVALDVTGLADLDAVSQESLGLAVGARLVLTANVRRTRRVVEVMARLIEARA